MAHYEGNTSRCFNGFFDGSCNVSVFSFVRPNFKVFFRNVTEGKYLMKNWYIVQSHSSFENKVAAVIKEEADKGKISEKF